MKVFIAFILLFFMNCLAPVAISATVNIKTAVAHSVTSHVKRLSFKEKLYLKLLGKSTQKLTMSEIILIFGILLLIGGLILISTGESKSAAQPANSLVPHLAGLGESVFGVILLSFGIIMSLSSAIKLIKHKRILKPTS
jgi:hypothetical protein